MRRVLGPLAALALLAACTSVTSGHGSADPSATSSATSPSSLAPSSTPEPTDSASGSATAPGPALDCPAGSITAPGAPFCYPLPPGFSDVSRQLAYAPEWTYRTLITVGGHDLIEVLGSIYGASTDNLSSAQLRSLYNSAGLLQRGKLGFVSVGPVIATTVGGARGFAQQGTYDSGVLAHDLRLYSGRTVVVVSCQSLDRPAAIRRGCAQVFARLRIAKR